MTAVLLVTSTAPLADADLSAGESARLAALPGKPRRRTWRTARRALRLGLVAAGLSADTSAYGFPHSRASLSHSAELAVAAVLVGDPDGVAGVGVDVELDRTPDGRTAPFFLTEDEQAWMGTVPDQARPAALVRLWTVKEALFKADPGNAGTVLCDYAVGDPAAYRGGAVRVRGRGRPGPEFRYVSLALPRGAVSVAVALPERWRRSPVQEVDFEQVAKRVSAVVSVPVERLTPEVTVAELVPDSFMFIEVAVDLQEEFDVVLAQEDLKGIHTLADLTALLRTRQEEHAGQLSQGT